MSLRQVTRLLSFPLGLLLLVGAARGQGYPPAPGTPHIDFAAQDQDGQTFQLSAQAGKVVVLHYCAMWCGPCISSANAEAALIASIDSQLGVGNGIVIDALIQNVSFGPTVAADAVAWRINTGTPARTLHLDGITSSGLGQLGNQLTAFPTYVIIDTEGRVSKVILGFTGTPTKNALLSAVVAAWNASPGPLIRASTISSGQPQSAAGDALIDSSLDPSGGVVAVSNRYTLKPGYVGQLNEVVALSISAPFTIGEEEDFQLSAQGQMDDETFTQLNSLDVAWSVVSGPVASISASGLAHAEAVPTTLTERMDNGFDEGFLTALVRGEFGGFSGEREIDVFDFLHDNFGPVAGDGIDDAWQFEFFDADHNGILEGAEIAAAAPGANPDHDLSSNFIEWAGGFDPLNGNSHLMFRILDKQGPLVRLEINQILAGTTYRVIRAESLGPDASPFQIFESTAPANDLDVVVEDPDAVPAAAFYRLSLERSP